MRVLLPLLMFAADASPVSGQAPAVTLREQFSPDTLTRVRLESNLSGRLAVPQDGKKTPDVLPFNGKSVLEYDERLLPNLGDSPRVVRQYRVVEFARTIGDRPQSAEVRPAVRRMVVIRSGGTTGKKVPFSPDGPLTLGEIDVVRIDLFSPVLVPGLLPDKPVKAGDTWKASDAAVADLTDYEAVETNTLAVEFSAVVTLGGQRFAKLAVSGTVSGTAEDGPSRQALSGTAYFDLDANRLTYLKLVGKNQLLGPKGVTAGEVTGTFTLARGPVPGGANALAPDALAKLDLAPTAANSLLLHDDPAAGVRFTHPRNWRVGITAGTQLAIDESSGKGGLLLTLYPPGKTPTAAAYLADVKTFGVKEKWRVTAETPPTKDPANPAVERFGLDVVTAKTETLRLEYAVVTTPAGGATAAVRLVAGPTLEALKAEAAGIVRGVTLSKPAE